MHPDSPLYLPRTPSKQFGVILFMPDLGFRRRHVTSQAGNAAMGSFVKEADGKINKQRVHADQASCFYCFY